MRVVPRAWKRRAVPVVATALFVVASCGRRPVSPPVPPPLPPAHAIPGYEALADSLSLLDTSGLKGRRIALDPGHGGVYRGAMGVHGLTEAEVNLAVALRLRDLLVAQGAEV